MNIWGSVLVTHLCPTLCNPMDLPGSSVCGILQERILEWVDIPFSKGSSWPRTQTWVFCIADRYFFYRLSHQGSPYLGLRATPENATEAYGLFWIKVIRKTVSTRRGLWPLFLSPRNQEMSLSCERHSPCTRTQRDILITRGRVFRAKKPIQTNIVISLLI